jgi:single-strand selective monofunctional uracil DNA glycosylase
LVWARQQNVDQTALPFGLIEISCRGLKANAVSRQLVAAARELAAQVDRLKFKAPVAYVYHPLAYAWPAHELYLRKFGGGKKRVVFLGMNPGPFGMAQTGVPFGEVAAVRDWLKIRAPIGRPAAEHPKRPVLGLDCPRSEVSGRRLWGLFAKRFGTAEKFFADHFVANYCPLAFLEAGGRNLTPDKLTAAEQARLFALCDAHLCRVLEILEPEWLVGIGGFAANRGRSLCEDTGIRVGRILHPSPASPAANRGWAQVVIKELVAIEVWGSKLRQGKRC